MNATPPLREVWQSSSSCRRLDRAAEWWCVSPSAERRIVIVPQPLALDRFFSRASIGSVPGGWYGMTLYDLACRLTRAALARQGLAVASRTMRLAVMNRVVMELAERHALDRFSQGTEQAGLCARLVDSFEEFERNGLVEADVPASFAEERQLYGAFLQKLSSERLIGTGGLLAQAADVANKGTHPLLSCSLLMIDVPLRSQSEFQLIRAMFSRAISALSVVPSLDGEYEPYRRVAATQHKEKEASDDPTRINQPCAIVSTKDEHTECVEIVRLLLDEARAGTPFDRMAMLLRDVRRYREPAVHALRRAGIPYVQTRGINGVDLEGRALLCLMRCAEEQCSAERFAEFLSLGAASSSRTSGSGDNDFVYSEIEDEEETLREEIFREETSAEEALEETISQHSVAPARWERMLREAGALAGSEWPAYLLALHQGDSDVRALLEFSAPILEALGAFPECASWSEWSERLLRLSSFTLRRSDRTAMILTTLAALQSTAPVSLVEVRRTLTERLNALTRRESSHSHSGALFLGSVDEVCGQSFHVIAVPGLVERVFPQAYRPDPLFSDRVRAQMSPWLTTERSHAHQERSRMSLVAGAAERRLIASYPLLDGLRNRPLTPSVFVDELNASAEQSFSAAVKSERERHQPARAIDETDYDLRLFQSLRGTSAPQTGSARYLMQANPFAARALRRRGRRWTIRRWTGADGLVDASAEARRALRPHQLDARSYSPTALEHFAWCPYRFFLRSIVGLLPPPSLPTDELQALDRGRLIHEVLFDFYSELRTRDSFPVLKRDLADLRTLLDRIIDNRERRYAERKGLDRDGSWSEYLSAVRTDMHRWLSLSVQRSSGTDSTTQPWTPRYFELGFGLAEMDSEFRDPASVTEEVRLDCGIRLRGQIDLVEQSGDSFRVTDYKTGMRPDFLDSRASIAGGRILQPVLYAMALEKLFPEAEVHTGRLDYCTERGRFTLHEVALGSAERKAVRVLSEALGRSLADGFFPARPMPGACDRCDYRPLCGNEEESRTLRKDARPLSAIEALRDLR